MSCVWVLTHSYFRDFRRVESLLVYRDFNRWFLPEKGEVLQSNGWVLAIPLLQWALSMSIVTVSWCMICGFDDAFDVVMNSMAFTFIAEVSETFAEPVFEHYAGTKIEGLDPKDYGTEPIYYIVTEYAESNSSETGWYVVESDQRSGLLTDFRYRHQPGRYPQPHKETTGLLRALYFAVPPIALVGCFIATHKTMPTDIAPATMMTLLDGATQVATTVLRFVAWPLALLYFGRRTAQ